MQWTPFPVTLSEKFDLNLSCPVSDEVHLGAELATASGVVQADTFVIAAGLGTAKLASMAGVEVPLEDKPATLNVYTVPAPPLLRHMLLSGGILFGCNKAH